MQFYPKVLPSFTHVIIGKRWVKLGKAFYPPNPVCYMRSTDNKQEQKPNVTIRARTLNNNGLELQAVKISQN